MRNKTAKAIKSFRPGMEFSLKGDPQNQAQYDAGFTLHKGGPKPTWTEIITEKNRLQAEHDGKDFERKRRAEYPSVEEQLEALWAGGQEMANMKARIKAVQDKHPKA